MPRRRLLPLALAVVAVLGAGCADTVSPALRVDDASIGNDALLEEIAEWAGNAALLEAVQFPPELVAGASPGSYSTELVGFVLGSRIGFELHRAEFEDRGLALSQGHQATVREQLFGDPQVTAQVLGSFSDDYAERLVDDIARQIALEQDLGAEYATWAEAAYADAEVEVNPRYGSWDAESRQVVGPEGPITRTSDIQPLG